MHVAVLCTDGVEQAELTRLMEALRAEGADARLVSLESGSIQAVRHMDKADRFDIDEVVSRSSSSDHEALVIPGGVVSPDRMRMDPDAVRFVRDFFTAGKPVASICHGPWMLVEADVVCDRTLTSWPSLQTDIRNAGGNWVDEEVVRDGRLVTSRKPHDLDAFCREMVALFEESRPAPSEGAASSVTDQVEEASEESFPASDPPSYTPQR
jgi:protease I